MNELNLTKSYTIRKKGGSYSYSFTWRGSSVPFFHGSDENRKAFLFKPLQKYQTISTIANPLQSVCFSHKKENVSLYFTEAFSRIFPGFFPNGGFRADRY